MSQTRVLVLVAGAALSTGTVVFAQNANLDQDRAYAAELVADAGTRSSLLQGGASGYDGMFNISDGTGNNRLNIGGTAQLRWTVSIRDDESFGDPEDFNIGFNTPTTRLRAWGNVWDKALSYKIQGDFGSDGGDNGSFGLQEAWGKYTTDNGLGIRWGQFKLPVIRESLVDDEYQLAIDRSETSQVFDQQYSQGIEVSYAADAFRIFGAYSDGAATANTDFNSGAEADFAVTVRAEGKFMGADWERFNDFTSWRSAADNGLLVGAAAHFQTGGDTGGTAEVDAYILTADAQFEGQGWNVMGAVYASNVDAGGADSDTFGWTVQGGVFVADQWEIFARANMTMFDDTGPVTSGGADDELMFATIGVNYYLSPESHAAKFSAEVSTAFNDTSGFFSADNTNNGFLGDTEDGEIVIRWQMQVMF
jgi:hypothetical protein